jgi:glucosylceramidase
MMKSAMRITLLLWVGLLFLGCEQMANNDNYKISATSSITVTSEAGDVLAEKANVDFTRGRAQGTVIQVYPDTQKQVIDGIGSSFTEASAFVLAHLPVAERQAVMREIFSESGANFSLTRTHIGACDFCVEGRYSYVDKAGDTALESFSLEVDVAGFSQSRYPGIKDVDYDLLPMIKEAQAIKAAQSDSELRIVASAWTAPAWMKDIEDWFMPGGPDNNWQGTGGHLKPEYEATYAAYLVKYLAAYAAEGVNIWGLTPVNEPHGNNGQWESMHFSPQTQNEFIKKYLGPKLVEAGFGDKKLLIYDQNRGGLEEWTDAMFADPQTAPYLYGAAVHWYGSTVRVYEEVFERVKAKFPDFAIVHTEGCIDDLGKDPPDEIGDPVGFKESGWFKNDAFWWNKNATDWGYTAPWESVVPEDHPMYTPVHRYARNIIVSIDHWLTGWIDWNIVLDKDGGPNHVGNFCGAPIMIDTEKQDIYYTPIFHVLKQFSRTIRPGDVALQTRQVLIDLGDDDLHACATVNAQKLVSVQVLNTSKAPISYALQIGDRYASISIPANAVQTVQVQL